MTQPSAAGHGGYLPLDAGAGAGGGGRGAYRPLSVRRGRVGILILCSVFAVAGLGLIRMRRWGWALTLGAVFLCHVLRVL